jgi:hypothetical protein
MPSCLTFQAFVSFQEMISSSFLINLDKPGIIRQGTFGDFDTPLGVSGESLLLECDKMRMSIDSD